MSTPVPSSPALTGLLDRISRGRGEKLLRFGMASVVGIVITQVAFVVCHGALDLGPLASNLIAVSVAAGPVFLLNKRWVWGQGGRPSMRFEVMPFWGFTLLGLAISTLLVALASKVSDLTIVLMAANIGGFGLVWLSKFLFLDGIVFAAAEAREERAAAAAADGS